MNLNKVLLVGNLTRDPESSFLQSGSQVAKFGIAVNRKFNKRDGSKGEEVLYIDVECWNRTAELVQQYLVKGSQALVEGRLKMDSWQSNSGEKRTKIFVIAESVQFGARSGSQAQQSPKTERAPAPAASGGSSWGGSSYEQPSWGDDDEDELPF